MRASLSVAMLRNCHFKVLALLPLAFLTLSACSSPHFFPRLKPLFPGLDESKMSASARASLGKAKQDFQLARHKKEPVNAHYVSTLPYSHSRVFEGDGYCITMTNRNRVKYTELGPKIVISASITGGKPFCYDEIDR